MTSSEPSPATITKPRRRWWRRRSLIFLVLLLAALWGGRALYRHLTDPQRVAALAEAMLGQMSAAEVHVGKAQFSLRRPLVLEDVEMRVPGLQGMHGRLFSAKKVVVDYDGWKMLVGRFRARQIEFVEPVLYPSEDLATGRLNVQALYEIIKSRPSTGEPLPALPRFVPADVQVLLGQRDASGVYSVRAKLDVHLNFQPVPGGNNDYDFALTPKLAAGLEPRVLHGRFNTSTGEISAQLDRFRFDAAQRAWLPAAARQWWDELQPAGQWTDLRVWALPGVQSRFSIHAQPDHFSIRLVDTMLDLLPQLDSSIRSRGMDYRPVLDSGTIEVTEQGISLGDLHGRVEGFDCVVTGHWVGLSIQRPFDISARIEGVTTTEARYLASLPPGVKAYFQRFEPLGHLKAEARAARTVTDGPLTYSGKVHFDDVRARYFKFPYPLEHLFGDLEFNEQRITITDMKGRLPSGGAARIDVQVEPPSDEAKMHIVVAAQGMPVDSTLFDAIIDPADLTLIQGFFDAKARQKLVDAGLIQGVPSTQPVDADGVSRVPATQPGKGVGPALPAFVLGGKLDITIQVDRAAGPKPPPPKTAYDTQITLRPLGVNMLNAACLYPIHVDGGALTISPASQLVTAKDMSLKGLTGATGLLNGTFKAMDDPNRPLVPNLDITVANLPIDNLLAFAIGGQAAVTIRELGLAGKVGVTGHLGPDKQGKITPDFKIDFQGGAKPFGGGFELQNVLGTLALKGRELRLEKVTGQRDQSSLTLVGGIQLAERRPALDLKVTGMGLHFDDPLADLLPTDEAAGREIRDLQQRFKPGGTFDADLTYHRPAGDEPATFQLELRPKDLNFDYGGGRTELRDVHGTVVVTPGQIDLRKISAALGEMHLSGNGTIQRGDIASVELDLGIENGKWDQPLRRLLPVELNEAMDAIEFGGALGFHGKLSRHDAPGDDGKVPGTHLEGRLDVKDAKAEVGLPLTQIDGAVDVLVMRNPQEKRPRMDLKFALQKVRAQDRLISSLNLRVSNVKDIGLLEISDLKGAIYGGTVTNSGPCQVELGAGAEYSVKLALQDTALDPFVHPADDQRWRAASQPAGGKAPPAANENDPSGTIVASLALKGTVGKPLSKQGRGAVEVHGARLFEVPLFLSLLDVLGLNWPRSRVVDNAASQFIVDGDTVRLDHIHLGSPTLDINGSGTMVYSTQALDLVLTPHSNGILPGIRVIMSSLQGMIVGIRVGGTLTDPEPKLYMFPGLRSTGKNVLAPIGHAPAPSPLDPGPAPIAPQK